MPEYINRYLRLTFKREKYTNTITMDESWKVTFRIRKYAAADILSFNTAEISVYNMTSELREMLAVKNTSVKLEAGYAGMHNTIFTGIVNNVATTKQATELVTTFYCQSDTRAYENLVQECVQNITVTDLLKKLCEDRGISYRLPFTRQDVIKQSYTGTFSKVVALICHDYGISLALDNGVIIFRDKKQTANDVEASMIKVYTPTSGILGNPTVTEVGIRFKALMQPSLKINDYFRLEAPYADYNLNSLETRANTVLGDELNTAVHVDTRSYKGVYMALSMTFSGDTRGNSWYTDVEGARLGIKTYA